MSTFLETLFTILPRPFLNDDLSRACFTKLSPLSLWDEQPDGADHPRTQSYRLLRSLILSEWREILMDLRRPDGELFDHVFAGCDIDDRHDLPAVTFALQLAYKYGGSNSAAMSLALFIIGAADNHIPLLLDEIAMEAYKSLCAQPERKALLDQLANSYRRESDFALTITAAALPATA